MRLFSLTPWLLPLFATAIVSTGCGLFEDDPEPVVIGALLPLSTPGAVGAGEAMRDAMNIAVEELNERGGILDRPAELRFADSRGTPDDGVAAVRSLLDDDSVVAVAGGFHSSVAIQVKDLADERGVPIVFADVWADAVTSAEQRSVFRIGPLNSEISATDVDFIASLPDINTVAIVTENTDFGIPVAQKTGEGLAEYGIDSLVFSLDIGAEDFSDVVRQVVAAAPDLIAVYSTGEAGYRLQQQAADAGIGPQDLPFLCNQESMESEAFWDAVPDGNLCFVRRVGLPAQQYGEVARSFADRYTASTGKQAAESYALEAYDAVMLLAQAIEEAESDNPDAIIEALEITVYEGAIGTITFPYNSENPPSESGLDVKWWHQFLDPAITIVQYQEPEQNSADAPVVFPDAFRNATPILAGR